MLKLKEIKIKEDRVTLELDANPGLVALALNFQDYMTLEITNITSSIGLSEALVAKYNTMLANEDPHIFKDVLDEYYTCESAEENIERLIYNLPVGIYSARMLVEFNMPDSSKVLDAFKGFKEFHIELTNRLSHL